MAADAIFADALCADAIRMAVVIIVCVCIGAVQAADPDSDQNIVTDAQLETSEAITDSDFELPNGELLTKKC